MTSERRAPEPMLRTRLPDRLWLRMEPIIRRRDPELPVGRHRLDPRLVLEAVIYHARSGCGWKRLPDRFPAESSVRRTFLRWRRLGIMDDILAIIAEEAAARATGAPVAVARRCAS